MVDSQVIGGYVDGYNDVRVILSIVNSDTADDGRDNPR